MSIQDLNSAFVPVDHDGSHSPAHVPEETPDMDTEMTSQLTEEDDHSVRSRSSSPVPVDEMSGFQSARERNARKNVNNQARPAQPARSSGSIQGLAPSSWRNTEMSSPPSTAQFYSSTPPYDPSSPMIGSHPANRVSYMLGENSVPLSTVCPGAVWPIEDQLDTSYAYGIRRDDGSISRLLPADEFPTVNIPPRQGPEGLIVLPAPKQPAPNPNMPDRMVSMEVVQKLPPLTFVPPQYPVLPMQPVSYDATQQQIDSIVQSSSSVTTPVRRREKIFCDKWIHEGVCAFTQMGCKYKHEMPMDRATQLTLGLNHGIPNWYRKAYAINLHPSSPPMLPMYSPPSNGKRTEGPWRRLEGAPQMNGFQANRSYQGHQGHQGSSMGGNMQSGPRGENRSTFGPIAPPQIQSYTNNPYSALKVEQEAEDEDDDEMVYKGRNR